MGSSAPAIFPFCTAMGIRVLMAEFVSTDVGPVVTCFTIHVLPDAFDANRRGRHPLMLNEPGNSR